MSSTFIGLFFYKINANLALENPDGNSVEH